MNDYKELIVKCEEWIAKADNFGADDLANHISRCADAIEQLVKERDANIDAEPVRHGHWKEIQVCRIYNEDTVYSIGYKCNQCGRVESKKEPYCHCGAKMMNEVSE